MSPALPFTDLATTSACATAESTGGRPGRVTSQHEAWLRAALDFSRQLLARADGDRCPWTELAASIRRLVDADRVTIMAPPAHEPLSASAALGRVMALPLVGRKGTYGVIEVCRRIDQPAFTEGDRELVRSLADEVTGALELSEARVAEHRTRLLEDRERIARDLHDQVIQRLFATGLRLQGTATATKDLGDRDRLTTVIDELDETVRQIRTSIFALNCSDASARTLRRVVIEVAESVGSAFDLRPQVRFRGPIDVLVDGAVVEDVEAVVREGLTNAGKHAQAGHVTVALAATSQRLWLVIEDDGVGLSGSDRSSGTGNMRRRAERHGGTLTVENAPSGGVQLCWSVPLH